jgi:hypothetical protein
VYRTYWHHLRASNTRQSTEFTLIIIILSLTFILLRFPHTRRCCHEHHLHSDTGILANDVRLIVINVQGYPGPIEPPLVPDINELTSVYTMEFPNYITQAALAGTSKNSFAMLIVPEYRCRSTFRDIDDEFLLFDLNLPVGVSTFRINVQSQKWPVDSNYTMEISRDPSDSAYLATLDYVPQSPIITQAALFVGSLFSYTMHVANPVKYLNFTATDQDTGTMSFLGWYIGPTIPDGNYPRSQISRMQLGVMSASVPLAVPRGSTSSLALRTAARTSPTRIL